MKKMKLQKVGSLLFIILTLACSKPTELTASKNILNLTQGSVNKTEITLPLQLKGGFIEYKNSMMGFGESWGSLSYKPEVLPQHWTPYPIDWDKVLESMRRAGMDTIIIKSLAVPSKVDGKDHTDRFYKPIKVGNKLIDAGPTEKILTYADKHQMKVYIGLWEDKKFGYIHINEEYLFGPRPPNNPNDPRDAVGHNKQIAQEVWPLYREHASFVGWYIPQEIWNIPERAYTGNKPTTELLNRFFREITQYCKITLASNKEVAISPFFSTAKAQWNTEKPSDITPNYIKILDNSGIDILMLQDRVGVNGLDKKLDVYFQAFRDAVDSINGKRNQPAIQFWVNLENFEGDQPAKIERIKKQFCLERRFNPSKFVTFDFYHFMNPEVPDCCTGSQTFPEKFDFPPNRDLLYLGYILSIHPLV
jgi:hypothetical protein